MTFEQVKQHYLSEELEYALATEKQVDQLSDWLDANDYYNSAHQRWDNDQEEMRYLAMEG